MDVGDLVMWDEYGETQYVPYLNHYMGVIINIIDIFARVYVFADASDHLVKLNILEKVNEHR
jgi:hypothetical protein